MSIQSVLYKKSCIQAPVGSLLWVLFMTAPVITLAMPAFARTQKNPVYSAVEPGSEPASESVAVPGEAPATSAASETAIAPSDGLTEIETPVASPEVTLPAPPTPAEALAPTAQPAHTARLTEDQKLERRMREKKEATREARTEAMRTGASVFSAPMTTAAATDPMAELKQRLEQMELQITDLQAKSVNVAAPASGGIAYDSVPKNQRNAIAKRLKIVDTLIRKYGQAYDYRAYTTQELLAILDQQQKQSRRTTN